MSEIGRVRIDTACLTDPGMTREENQDSYLELRGPTGEQLLLVADGMGGHRGGSTASQLLVKVVEEKFRSAADWDLLTLEDAITEGNAQVYGAASADIKLSGMGTTVVAVLFGGQGSGDAWVAHVGDSRAYRVRDERIERLTEDHSTVGELVRRGAISEEEAATHPRRNEILRSVGGGANVKIETAILDVRVGDRLMLCSDGLYGVVRDPEIADVLGSLPPGEAVPRLVSMANDNGGPDNVTVLVSALEFDEKGQAEVSLPGSDEQRNPLTLAASIAAALLLLGVIGWLIL